MFSTRYNLYCGLLSALHPNTLCNSLVVVIKLIVPQHFSFFNELFTYIDSIFQPLGFVKQTSFFSFLLDPYNIKPIYHKKKYFELSPLLVFNLHYFYNHLYL